MEFRKGDWYDFKFMMGFSKKIPRLGGKDTGEDQ